MMFVILNLGWLVMPTMSQTKYSGELSPTGQIRLNGQAVALNTTIVSGSVINTEEAEATIHLKKLGKIVIYRTTNLTLTFSENTINITLESGKVNLATFRGVTAQVRTQSSLATADVTLANKFTVTAKQTSAQVEIQSGMVGLSSSKKSKPLARGKEPAIATPKFRQPPALIEIEPEIEAPKVSSILWLISVILDAGTVVETALKVGATGNSSDINTISNTVNVGPNK